MDAFEEEKLNAGWHSVIQVEEHGHRSRETTYLYHPKERSLRIVHGLGGRPAVSLTDLRTGVIIREEWRINTMHRENGPALIERDGRTGVVIREDWILHGRHHRMDGGPSIVRYDRISGAVIYEGSCIKGRLCSERRYPENDLHPTARELAARERWKKNRLLKGPAGPT